MKTIAGTLVGLDKHTVVVTDDNLIVKNLRILGDRIYVAKCLKDENAGGVIITEKSRENCTWFLVLAVGTKYRGDIRPMVQVSLPDSTMDAEFSGYAPHEWIVPASECQTICLPRSDK